MILIALLFTEIIVIVIYMTAWFFIAQVTRRNDIADIAWGPGFIVTAITAASFVDSITPRGLSANWGRS